MKLKLPSLLFFGLAMAPAPMVLGSQPRSPAAPDATESIRSSRMSRANRDKAPSANAPFPTILSQSSLLDSVQRFGDA